MRSNEALSLTEAQSRVKKSFDECLQSFHPCEPVLKWCCTNRSLTQIGSHLQNIWEDLGSDNHIKNTSSRISKLSDRSPSSVSENKPSQLHHPVSVSQSLDGPSSLSQQFSCLHPSTSVSLKVFSDCPLCILPFFSLTTWEGASVYWVGEEEGYVVNSSQNNTFVLSHKYWN